MKITELFPDVTAENKDYEYKAVLPKELIKWAKTIVGFANSTNGNGGTLFFGVSDNGDVIGLDRREIDKIQNRVDDVNEKRIYPPVKLDCKSHKVSDDPEKFVLEIKVSESDSYVSYRDENSKMIIFIRRHGNTTQATPEDIIALLKRKRGVDNETSEVLYTETEWTGYAALCREYGKDSLEPTLKELQNKEIVSKDGYAKTGFLMFKDGYANDDTLICCRLWRGRTKTSTTLDSDRLRAPCLTSLRKRLYLLDETQKQGGEKRKMAVEKRSVPIQKKLCARRW